MAYIAAGMIEETDEHSAKLKDEVYSPADSTIYGVHALEKGRVAVIDALLKQLINVSPILVKF